jgi:SAM-dependent methyltransferase
MFHATYRELAVVGVFTCGERISAQKFVALVYSQKVKVNVNLALKWALQSISSRGLVRTAKVASSVLVDLGFDLQYGTETMRWVWREDLGINSEHAAHYRATKARSWRKLMSKLDLPRDCVFVDLGCGKGRVLLLAAQLGFEKVLGVEFSPRLCAIARGNVKIFTRRARTNACIDVIESDVARYDIKPEQCIFFAYNPFDEVVMERFVANLRDSLKRFPRKVWLLYNTPIHAVVIERSKLFTSCEEFEIGGVEFKVFTNR